MLSSFKLGALTSAIVVCGLTACGGQDQNPTHIVITQSSPTPISTPISTSTPTSTPTSIPTPWPPVPTSPPPAVTPTTFDEYDKLQRTGIEASVLKPATEQELARHLKNGLRLNVTIAEARIVDPIDPGQVTAIPTATAVPIPAATPAAAAPINEPGRSVSTPDANIGSLTDGQESFSGTNTHVWGVDEADVIKYDGKYLYIANSSEYLWNRQGLSSSIRIMETDPTNAAISQIGNINIPISDTWAEINELYLLAGESGTDAIITMRSSGNYYDIMPLPMPAVEARPVPDTTPTPNGPILSDAVLSISPVLPTASPTPSPNPSTIFTSTPTPTPMLGDLTSPPFYDNRMPPKIAINGYSVIDPTAPVENFSLEIDGRIFNSRKIGNMLYLVTNYSVQAPDIHYYFDYTKDAEENESRIVSIPLTDLLPKYRLNGGEETALFAAEDCLLPADINDSYGYANIVSLIAIDLAKQDVASVRCLNTQVDGIYASQNAIYLGGSRYEQWRGVDSMTVIHKFTLQEGLPYVSTGFVPGVLGWTDPSFRMDEYQDHLRVVTTWNNPNTWAPQHQLTILRDSESSDEMEFVAGLPNAENPAPIGKPNESIYAVRFMGDRGYVVTFLQIDPLYVLDLADPSNPKIAGELEVPGFSNYLHPIDENYLVGIGRESGQWNADNGLKISLFDIRDIDAPKLVNDQVIGSNNISSQIEYDLRALSVLRSSDDQIRLAFPSVEYDYGNWDQPASVSKALQLFEVNGLAGDNADLSWVGSIEAKADSDDNTNFYGYEAVQRSVLHDEAVYFVFGSEVWASFWASPASATGPH